MGMIAGFIALGCGLVVAPICGSFVASRRQKKKPEAYWALWFLLGTLVSFPLIVVGVFLGLAAALLRSLD